MITGERQDRCEDTQGGPFGGLARLAPVVRFVEYTHWEVGKVVGAHVHDDMFQLDHFPRGEGTYRIDGQQQRISPATFFLVRPGRSHEVIGSQEKLLENLTVKFSHPSLAEDFLPPVFELPMAEVRKIVKLFRAVVSAGVMNDPAQRVIASYRLAEMLVSLRGGWKESQRAEEAVPVVAAAKAFMQEHLAEPIKLRDLADVLGVAAEHLCRVFRKHAGTTAFGYLRTLRLKRAQRLLDASDAKIRKVAAEAGFGTSAQMNRVFQKYLGVSPGQYRRRKRTHP